MDDYELKKGTFVGPKNNRKKYEIIEQISRGEIGIVYKGKEVKSGKEMAIKVMINDPRIGDSKENWNKEIDCLKKVSDICKFSGILCYEDHFSYKNDYFIVTPYLKNYITLRDYLNSNPKLENKAYKIVDQISDSLFQLREVGLAHGDLHFDNIMIQPDNLHTVIIDLGECVSKENEDESNMEQLYKDDLETLDLIKSQIDKKVSSSSSKSPKLPERSKSSPKESLEKNSVDSQNNSKSSKSSSPQKSPRSESPETTTKLSKSKSPFRIGKSMSIKSSPKKILVFTFNELYDLIKNYVETILDKETSDEISKKISNLLLNLYKNSLKKDSNFIMEGEQLIYLKSLNHFRFDISQQDLENFFTKMYRLSGTKQKNGLFKEQAKKEFKIFNGKLNRLIEKNLNIPIKNSLKGINLRYEVGDSTSMKQIGSLFFENFFEKRDLGSLFYLKYILSQNNNVCVPILNTDDMINEIKILIEKGNDKLKNYITLGATRDNFIFQAMEIIFEENTSELVWEEKDDKSGNLKVTKRFEQQFLNCLKNSDKRFIVSFFQFNTKSCSHMNILVYDRKLNEIERFEPNGSSSYSNEICPEKEADLSLKKYFNELGIKYISPLDFCPKIGIQKIYEKETDDENGFCVTWSFLYANERLLYPELSRKQVIDSMKKRLEKSIEKYESLRDYFEDRISQVLSFYKDELDKINRELNTNYYLDGRTLTVKY
jgi:serine/threonine protein kinase